MTGNPLAARIEAALDAADTMADLALTLNEGIESPELAAAIRAYVKAARGLDLREFTDKQDKQDKPDSPYTCPTCGRTSHNPQDAAHLFCAVCGFEEDRLGTGIVSES